MVSLSPQYLAPLSPTVSWREVAAGITAAGPDLARLSPAERVVAAHLCQGLTNREIAAILGKSERTVKNQVSAVLAKCGVPTRARLIALLR
jgi:DNA-binding CsgD family transcriptional regulator